MKKKKQFNEQKQKPGIKLKDHVTLGKALDLFYTDSMIGKGLPLLTPKGTIIKQVLIRFIEDEEQKRGYVFTSTPVLARDKLYRISGHWDHYQENMFLIPGKKREDYLVLRPMTCPHQFSLYNRKKHSYRDLPVRYAETSTLFRNETSGNIYGLIRIRQFTLSDGHIICRPDQIESEFSGCIDLVNHVLSTLGFHDFSFRFSLWDPHDKRKYIDNPRAWEESQNVLQRILDNMGVYYYKAEGEAAFYGPKLDVQMNNIWGKEETIFTIQLDFALPERFNMNYYDEAGKACRPMLIHRSSIGCYERTMAMLIERYQGRFPFWLAPCQVKIININDDVLPYADSVRRQLMGKGIRVSIDTRNETLEKRIHWAIEEHIPVIAVLGRREQQEEAVSVRLLNGKHILKLFLSQFIKRCMECNQARNGIINFFKKN